MVNNNKYYQHVLIVGNNHLQTDIATIEAAYQAKGLIKNQDYIIVGDGTRNLTDSDILQLTGKLGPETIVSVVIHGSIVAGKHLSDERPTTELFSLLKQAYEAGVTVDVSPAMELHFYACKGGKAAEDIMSLPKGTVLFTHAAYDSITVNYYIVEAIKKSIVTQRSAPFMHGLAYCIIPETYTITYLSDGQSLHHTVRGPAKPIDSINALQDYVRKYLAPEYCAALANMGIPQNDIALEIKASAKELSDYLITQWPLYYLHDDRDAVLGYFRRSIIELRVCWDLYSAAMLKNDEELADVALSNLILNKDQSHIFRRQISYTLQSVDLSEKIIRASLKYLLKLDAKEAYAFFIEILQNDTMNRFVPAFLKAGLSPNGASTLNEGYPANTSTENPLCVAVIKGNKVGVRNLLYGGADTSVLVEYEQGKLHAEMVLFGHVRVYTPIGIANDLGYTDIAQALSATESKRKWISASTKEKEERIPEKLRTWNPKRFEDMEEVVEYVTSYPMDKRPYAAECLSLLEEMLTHCETSKAPWWYTEKDAEHILKEAKCLALAYGTEQYFANEIEKFNETNSPHVLSALCEGTNPSQHNRVKTLFRGVVIPHWYNLVRTPGKYPEHTEILKDIRRKFLVYHAAEAKHYPALVQQNTTLELLIALAANDKETIDRTLKTGPIIVDDNIFILLKTIAMDLAFCPYARPLLEAIIRDNSQIVSERPFVMLEWAIHCYQQDPQYVLPVAMQKVLTEAQIRHITDWPVSYGNRLADRVLYVFDRTYAMPELYEKQLLPALYNYCNHTYDLQCNDWMIPEIERFLKELESASCASDTGKVPARLRKQILDIRLSIAIAQQDKDTILEMLAENVQPARRDFTPLFDTFTSANDPTYCCKVFDAFIRALEPSKTGEKVRGYTPLSSVFKALRYIESVAPEYPIPSAWRNHQRTLNKLLADAVTKGSLPQVEEALAQGAGPNIKGNKKIPVLHEAIKKQTRDIATALFDAGADSGTKCPVLEPSWTERFKGHFYRHLDAEELSRFHGDNSVANHIHFGYLDKTERERQRLAESNNNDQAYSL